MVPRGDEAQRRSHPGLVDGGYQLKIVKHAPARAHVGGPDVFRHDLDGDGCDDRRRRGWALRGGEGALRTAVSIFYVSARGPPLRVTVPDDRPWVPRDKMGDPRWVLAFVAPMTTKTTPSVLQPAS